MATLKIIIQNGREKGYSVSFLGRFAFLSSLAALLLFFGCEKLEPYSDIPEITYLSHKLERGTDQLGNLVWNGTIKFEFKDGDGNFGLNTPDSTTPPDYRYNLFLTRFDKEKGAFVEVPDSSLPAPLSYTIPFVEPDGYSKQQRGTVSVAIQYLTHPSDTIKYRFYIKDRALNSSNAVETAEIIFNPPQK